MLTVGRRVWRRISSVPSLYLRWLPKVLIATTSFLGPTRTVKNLIAARTVKNLIAARTVTRL